MNIRIVTDSISIDELKQIGKEFYDSMIKGVVDIEQEIVAFGGEYHIDAANVLTESGSLRRNLWGFNIQFDLPKDFGIEYTSLINIRPDVGNRDMEISDQQLRDTIKRILESKIV